MAEYEVRTANIQNNAEEFSRIAESLSEISEEILNVAKNSTNSLFQKLVTVDRINTVASSVNCCSADCKHISRGLIKAAKIYNRSEKKIIDKSFGEAGKGGSGRDAEIKPKFPDWGKKPGTIAPVEYAWLCAAANEAAFGREEGDTNEILKAFLSKAGELPDGHALKGMNESNVEPINVEGIEGFIIHLSDDSAIVVFAGTDDTKDTFNDIGIIANNLVNPISYDFSAQAAIANAIITNLENRGITNISVTGHSLGGYLATDVALHHQSVQECYGFDPVGHHNITALANGVFNSGQTDKITTYLVNGSPLHGPGVQIGDIHRVNVNFNWDSIWPNHDMRHLRDEGLGGIDAINEMYK